MTRRLLIVSLVLAFTPACRNLSSFLEDQGPVDGMTVTPAADDEAPSKEVTLRTDDGADWIQIVSGEWLRGEILRVRDDSLDFDSDELGDQAFDFGDVLRIISPNHQVVLTEDGRIFEGQLSADGSSIWIEGDKTVKIPRSDVLSVLAVDGDGISTWSGEVSAGIAIRTGNTEQTDYSAVLAATRETARTRWASRYSGAISQVNGTETANNHRIGSTYDLFVTKRTFFTVPGVDIYRDPFQNIGVRVTPYAAIGYEVVDTADHMLAVSAGPAFQYQRFDSELASGGATDSSFAGVFSTLYDWDITGDVEFNAKYNITVPMPDIDEYNHNVVGTLSVDLSGDLDLDFSVTWDRINSPEANSSGIVPKKDDFRMTIGVGWTF
jgi:putative salt-induced outer membrane protein YdiY